MLAVCLDPPPDRGAPEQVDVAPGPERER